MQATRTLGPAASLPAVIDNASRLSEILKQMDSWTGDLGTLVFKTDVSNSYYEIIRRAALVRQREALEAIVSLCNDGHSAFAVCLLRPAYEELLWLEYLADNSEVANEIALSTCQIGISESLEAQAAYLGGKQMHNTGFSMKNVKAQSAKTRPIKSSLQILGKKLGWRDGATGPSVAFLARKVGREKQYSFLYQATSRFVHFSPHELVRRARGNPKSITISSAHFAGYWSAFALHWGFRIYLDTILTCSDLLPNGDEGQESHERIMALLTEYVPQVPIITREELEWPW